MKYRNLRAAAAKKRKTRISRTNSAENARLGFAGPKCKRGKAGLVCEALNK